MKKYKVTIIPYLNKDLKVKLVNEKDVYPLYFKVTYMRQTTLIRSINEERFSELNVEDQDIKSEMKELENLIFFLSECNTEPFSLNGLKDKYLLSQQSLIQAFDTLFRNQVKINLKKIKDPILVTLNVGEYSPEYPVHLLLNAVNDFYPKYTRKLFENCFLYADMIVACNEYYLLNDKSFPRLIEILALANKGKYDVEFVNFLVLKLKSDKKGENFYLEICNAVTRYLKQNF